MTLATATLEGWPTARIVLCKDVVGVPGYVVFYTNFRSRKGLELAKNPRAAAVMHWDHMHRQVRIEGLVQTAPAADSDAYFASSARDSRLGAWASAQSQPVASREALLEQVKQAAERFATGVVPRPSFWGGYRLWAEAVELWVAGRRPHSRSGALDAHPGTDARRQHAPRPMVRHATAALNLASGSLRRPEPERQRRRAAAGGGPDGEFRAR